jgi:hypothetical protein
MIDNVIRFVKFVKVARCLNKVTYSKKLAIFQKSYQIYQKVISLSKNNQITLSVYQKSNEADVNSTSNLSIKLPN